MASILVVSSSLPLISPLDFQSCHPPFCVYVLYLISPWIKEFLSSIAIASTCFDCPAVPESSPSFFQSCQPSSCTRVLYETLSIYLFSFSIFSSFVSEQYTQVYLLIPSWSYVGSLIIFPSSHLCSHAEYTAWKTNSVAPPLTSNVIFFPAAVHSICCIAYAVIPFWIPEILGG